MKPRKPDFLIIGSAKCGTTSLAAILSDHPDCCMSNPKEVSFFQDQIDFEKNKNFEKGWDWYKKAFEHYQGELRVGEATPSYTDRSRSPNTARRIFEFNPEMRLIYLVRDPMHRQLSAWKMQHYNATQGINPHRVETHWALKGFETWMQNQQHVGQWDICRYFYQLDAYLNYYPERQILVSFLEDWQIDQAAELDRICDFLKLDRSELLIRKPKGENRMVDRRVQPEWFRGLRQSSLVRMVSKFAPTGLKANIGMLVAKEAETGDESIRPETRAAFLSHIREDSSALLKKSGKSIDIWPSLSVDA